MLYQSLYVPEGATPFDRSMILQPSLAMYVKDWGRSNDSGFVAEDENANPIGAVWLRLFERDEKGFGHVDDRTPEIGMAVLPEYRGKGIGTNLLCHLIESVEGVFGYISLSVSVGNPVFNLYQRMGFEVVEQVGTSITMKRKSRSH